MVDTTLVITLTLSALATYLLLFTPVGGMVQEKLNDYGINTDNQFTERTTIEGTGDLPTCQQLLFEGVVDSCP